MQNIFALFREKFDALKACHVSIPYFNDITIPQFEQFNVEEKLGALNPKKAVPSGDIPPKLLNKFATQLAKPLTMIITSSIKQGIWPHTWKNEVVTPVAKVYPPKLLKNLSSISGLTSFNKVQEKLLSELIISDMKQKMDPSQYGNQFGLSIQHYLIDMINKILKDTDRGVTAVLATFVDWKDAFPNQCHKLGIEAFLKCGVRPSIIPLLISYFQERSVVVKWRGKESRKSSVPGGGPQGACLGNLEYLAQSNGNANCVEKDARFKFVDDLSALEKINLLLVGMASHNLKNQVPNDINMNNQIIPPQHLKPQTFLDKIHEWTKNQKMVINEDKTKCMVFNFTKKQAIFHKAHTKWIDNRNSKGGQIIGNTCDK